MRTSTESRAAAARRMYVKAAYAIEARYMEKDLGSLQKALVQVSDLLTSDSFASEAGNFVSGAAVLLTKATELMTLELKKVKRSAKTGRI